MGPCLANVESVRIERVSVPADAPTEVRRVLIVQNRPGEVPWTRLDEVVRRWVPDLVVFPEYAWYGPADIHGAAADRFPALQAEVRAATRRWSAWVVAGTFLRYRPDTALESVTLLLYGGAVRGSAVKVNPTERERQVGIQPGRVWTVWSVGPRRWLPLICADVFCQDRLAGLLRGVRLHVGVVPTASPYRPGEAVQAKWERDERIFRTLAGRVGAPVVKACCTGLLFGHRFQGRSLVALPERVLWRVEPAQEDTPLLACIDLRGQDPPRIAPL